MADLVKTRKELILRNIQEADTKFREASEQLDFAKQQFQSAKLKADQIKTQGLFIANQSSEKIIQSVENDIKRLKETSLATIRFEEEKSVSEVVRI